MDINSLGNVVKEGMGFLQPALSTVVGALLTTLFLRKNTSEAEFEIIKAGKFSDAIGLLLENGKMTYFEYYKCRNFLNVARLADKYQKERQKSEPERDNSFDFDWFIRFFDAVGNISNEKMQSLWAKVLSGEVSRQGSFSLRTLDTLRNMTQNDAMIFRELSGMVLDNTYIFSSCGLVGYNVNSEYAFDNPRLLLMDELGIINGMLCTSEETLDVDDIAGFENGDCLLAITSKVGNFKFEYKYYNLTRTGKELLPIVFEMPNNDYLCDIGRSLKNSFSSSLRVCVHPIEKSNDEKISYNENIDLIANSQANLRY